MHRSSIHNRGELFRGPFAGLFFSCRKPLVLDWRCLEWTVGAIRSGDITFRVEFITTPPDIDETLREVRGGSGRVVESAEHQGMKEWARKHLRAKGISVSQGEVSVLGYEVDVGSLKDDVYVECGDTEPLKVVDFLRSGLSIGVLPYDSEHIVWYATAPGRLDRLQNELSDSIL